MDPKQLQNLILIFAISLLGLACNESATVPETGTAVVEGRVEGSEEANKIKERMPVEGATVTAGRVTSDGSLAVFDNDAEAETDADGEFTLNIDVETIGDATGKIVVVAESEGQQWKTILAGELGEGTTTTLKPLNDESTAEAAVFQQVVANGETALISTADIEAYIGMESGAELQNNADAVVEFADALSAEAEARSRVFANQSVDITSQQMNEIRNAKAEALATLHSSLYASNSESARTDAYDIFLEAIVNAHANAEVNPNAYCKAKEAAGNLILKNISELSSSARAEVRANSANLVAIAVDNAMQARLEAANAFDSSVQSAIQAGIQLRSEIRATATATESEIESAFESYNEAIMEILKQEFSASAEIIVAVNNEINSTAGIKAALETTVDASTNTDVIVQAYSTFYSSVRSVVDNIFPTANQTEAQLISDVMILINLAN